MFYANRKLEAILKVVDRTLYEHFHNVHQSITTNNTEDLLRIIDEKNTMDKAKLELSSANDGINKSKVAYILSPFIFLILSEKFFIPHLYSSGIYLSVNKRNFGFFSLGKTATKCKPWKKRKILKSPRKTRLNSKCFGQPPYYLQTECNPFNYVVASTMDDSEDSESGEKSTNQSNESTFGDDHQLDGYGLQPYQPYSDSLRTRPFGGNATIMLRAVTRSVVDFFANCAFFSFVISIETIFRLIWFVGLVLFNKYVWSVLMVTLFALSEAFIHFVMAVVTILVEIAVIIDEHRMRKQQEEQFEEQTSKAVIPIDHPTNNNIVRTLSVRPQTIGDF